MNYLGYSERRLKELDGYWTAKEIEQQPASWMRTHAYLTANATRIRDFLEPLLERDDLRIILTGAGTSAFVGACLAPSLSRILGRQLEAIPTTDLVSGPEHNFHREVPTLLVSFARSGNSPESVAAVELASSMLDECHQLIVSCNAEGNLFGLCKNRPNCLALLMPEETNDRAFAMTSSFSCMLLAAIEVFTGIEAFGASVSHVSSLVEDFIRTRSDAIRALADNNFSRVIYLGSNGMAGLAREASLKLLELTDGKVLTTHESSLGVRHGPKSVLNEDSLVVIFMSADPHTRKYDTDIYSELVADRQVKRIVALTPSAESQFSGAEHFAIGTGERLTDLELLFPYAVFAQIYGFHQALKIGNRPDNPSAAGTVNRVVKGVNIYACTS
jgi:tagatose-6-phosphate ketose/aldose isomerase